MDPSKKVERDQVLHRSKFIASVIREVPLLNAPFGEWNGPLLLFEALEGSGRAV
jgi:hypothetical protein